MSNPPTSDQMSSTKPLFSLGGTDTGNKNDNAATNKPLFGSTQSGTSNIFGAGLGTTGQSGISSNFSSAAGQSGPSTGWNFGAAKTDESKPASSASFGTFSTPSKPATSTGQPFGLFGNTTTSSNNIASTTPINATPVTSKAPSLFANVSTTPAGPPPATSGPLFNLPPAGKGGASLFSAASPGEAAKSAGNPTASTSNIFGAPPQQPSTNQQSMNTGLFGSTAPKTTGSNLFAAPASQAQNSPLFTKPTESKITEPEKSSLFSFSGVSGQNTGGTGAIPASSGTETSKSTDTAPTKPAFSIPPASSQGNLSFGQPTSTSLSSTPGFFNNATSASVPSRTLFPNFGPKDAAPNSSAGQTPSLFPSQNTKKDTPAATPSGTGLFGNTSEKKDSTAPAAPAATAFSGLGQKKDDPNSGLKPSDSTTTGSTTAAPSFSTAPTPPSVFGGAAKPAGAGVPLFGNPSSAAESSSTASQATAPAPATGSTALGASNTGPAPSAQSRLKNKSMDEIITRWAADLSKYQKEFQVQAEKVASWDRMLLENGNAISKLYSKTFQAERDTAEVQKQLSAVEGNQEELAMWLDKYEREVDEMLARQVGQGEGLQGPDQERERTYKIAERVSDRLAEMGKELTAVIEEINEASTAISKTTKADDPLSQIVRVLNGHLSQLQVIDQNTAALQAKVNAARKEGQRLGSRSQGVLGSDAADDFYRSYMSRS